MSLLKTIKAQLGLSGTPANNFTLDASANNGTMKLARGNAGATTQDIMTVAADGKVVFPQNATPSSQTWQNVAASRLINTLYTNSTEQQIDINVTATNNTAGTLMWIEVNGAQTITSGSLSTANNRLSIYGRIPAGATYKVVTSAGTNSSLTWWELR